MIDDNIVINCHRYDDPYPGFSITIFFKFTAIDFVMEESR